MNSFSFACTLNINVPETPLTFKISLDDKNVYDINTTEASYDIGFAVPDDGKDHSIKFILDGKTDDHTKFVDDTVVESAQIEIKNITIEDINISDVLYHNTDIIKYTHNSNGYSDEITMAFDSIMAFNGVAEFKFTTPIYIWILENM